MKFLSQYGRFKNFHAGAPFAFAPTLDETQASKAMLIGSVEEVADGLGEWMDVLDLRHLMVFPELPGLTREAIDEQIYLVAEEVLPRVGVRLPLASPDP